mgnify:CR=1 FL=1
MSENKKTMAEVSVHAVTSADLEILRGQKGIVSAANPLRVHRYGEGFIVSLGMFYNGEDDAADRLKALGLSKEAIATLTKAAETGAAYLDINATASANVAKKAYFDISTEHLRVKDGDLLDGIGSGRIAGFVPVIVHNTEHGYIVDLRSAKSAEKLREFGFSENFTDVISHVLDNGASLIDFDQDADCEPGFSLFDQVTDEDITIEVAEHGFR